MSVLRQFFLTPEGEKTMRQLRLIVLALAAICVLALAAFAFVNRPPITDPGDDIIIKGGSLKIKCGLKHGKDCFGGNANIDTYSHKKGNGKIEQVTIRNSQNQDLRIFTRVELGDSPTIVINYAEPTATPAP
jgi:hypothetical protein